VSRDAVIFRLVARFGRERWNEHLKLLTSLLNGLGIAAWVGALVAPNVSLSTPPIANVVGLAALGLFCHLAAQVLMRYFAGKE
jgi:hypothetical protein